MAQVVSSDPAALGAGTRKARARRVEGGAAREVDETLAVERALEFRVDGAPGAVTMRTPGQDHDLLRGFLFAEGVIGDAGDLRSVELLDDGDDGTVVDVRLASPLVRTRLPERSTFASSSCGVCGKVSIESLAVRAPTVDADIAVPAAVVAALPERLASSQAVFRATGGLHATGLFTVEGELLCGREDVGRHNAMDKVLGWALAAGELPAAGRVLCVSGRLSFELVQKTVVAGVPVVVAVSAPSSLAVSVAERFGVTLCAFTRGDRFNVYTHPHRIVE